jgi:beta-lactam-binding protein with PASTA domain
MFARSIGLAVLIIVSLLIVLLIWLNFYTHHGQSRIVPNFHGLNMAQVETIAKKSRLKYTVIDSVYTSATGKGCVSEQNPQPGFKVKKWRTIELIINAFRPEMVPMPDLVDLPKRQAISVVESSGLTMGKLIYKPDLSVDIVLDQLVDGIKINKNDSVQKGSVIDLVLGKGLSNQRTGVPDLVGMKLESATRRILESSLNLGTFIYDSTIKSRVDTNMAFVYKQNPESREDATLQIGSSIYLWLTVDSIKLKADSTVVIRNDTVPHTEPAPQKAN